ncbi:hypothetical protein C8J56DRAFT_918413 [Mycena floridula]|nr:hypothetical protein C8J56DRAFT_918413 [Mycena floridula]
MVYVNSKKFACESCIKGHRSSSCHHTDRPLFEIKKKGRPVSQCEKCRRLRQSRKVHSKCSCTDKEAQPPTVQPLATASGSKSRRFIPIAPALPNGLKDVMEASQSSRSMPADSRQLVNSLLNPCNCRSLWACTCRVSPESVKSTTPHSGLTALALAAGLEPMETSELAPRSSSSTSRSSSPLHKKRKHRHLEPYSSALPPILPSLPSTSIPDFPLMPPISTITSLAGSGCTCGVECGCPGCEEHRGPEHVSKDHKSCSEGCGTCIDNQCGIALPGLATVPSFTPSTAMIERFLRRAAALPAPPLNRNSDPMETTYSTTPWNPKEQGFLFGVVNLPKLECCGGNCSCPHGGCRCGSSCDSNCAAHGSDQPLPEPVVSSTQSVSIATPSASIASTPVRSCCANRSK